MVKKGYEIAEQRAHMVVKSNALIQKSRYELSAQESKLILYLISKIQPDDDDFQSYTFSLRDLCAVCGIAYEGTNYKCFRDEIDSLRGRVFYIQTPEAPDEDLQCTWVTDCRINRRKNTVSVMLDYKLKPYLLQLRDNFTSYQLENILVMRSKYAIRMYELLLSYAYQDTYTVSLEELRERLGIKPEQYKVYNNFKVRVLDIALAEIILYTELNVVAKPVRDGHKIIGLTFLISKKSDFDAVRAMIARGAALEKGE